MATLSLREIAESQLNETPVIDGQLVCCLDTGRFYRDTGSSRVELEVDIICVSSLPLAPITDKFYLVVPDTLYFYDGTDFNLLTHPNVIEAIQENGADLDINDKTVNITVPTRVSELENDEGFISQDTNTTYTLKSSKSSKNGDVIVELENSDGGSDILQVVGDGITTVTTDANGIITITSTEEENKNTYAEAPYDNGPASRVVIDDGEMTVDSTFYLPFISESDSTLLSNDGILYNTFTSEYDADTIARLGEGVLGKMLLGSVGYYNGYATLVLGNNIPSGTAGNKYGAIQIYSSLANYWTLYGNKEATSNYMLFMPTATGCLVVAPDQTQVGDETTPIYITSDGMATTFSKTIGSSNQPVYINRGAITAMDSPLSTIYGGTGTSLGHMEIGFAEDTESSIAPGAGETFTVIDEVTRDYFGHVTSLNTKTILLPVSSFSDTKVTQELTSESATYPVLLAPAGQTGTSTTSAYFGTKIQANPGTGALTATSFIGSLTGNADTATTADVAELIGTGTVGSELNPIYILNGSPTASTATIGGTAQPTFFNNGVIAPITASVGSATQPVYLNNGVITAMSGTLAVEYGGTGTKNGHINIVFDDDTDSSETLNPGESFTVIDDVTRDNYGHITKVNVKTILLSGVGFADTKVTQELTSKSDDYPILLAPAGQSATTTTSAYFGTELQANPSTGELIAKTFVGNLSGNADSATTATNADVAAKVGTINVGSDATPIYIVGGTPTAISDTIGSSAQPVYLNSGAITPIYDSIGSSSQPVYLDGGVIKPIGTLSAIYGGTGTTTGHIKIDSLTINSSSTTLEFGGDFEVIDSITRDDFGHITAYNVEKLSMPHDSVGNGTNFIYFNGGVPTASSSTVGAANKPIWMDGGTLKEITNPISIALGGTGTDTGHCSVSVSNYASDDSKAVTLGGIIQTVSDVTRDEYGHVLYYALDTITLSQTIPLTLTNPNAETTYYMPFSEKSEDVLRYNDGITYTTYSPEYDSNTGAILGSAILGKMLLGSNGYNDGYALLTLGNNTSYGIAGNKYGELRLYGAGTKYWTINGSKRTTSDYVLFLPESNGCLVVAHDGEKTGDDVTPVYIADNGEVTASLGTVGSVEQPVYLNKGTITAMTGTIGRTNQPVWVNQGMISAMDQPLAAEFGGTGTATGHMDITIQDNTFTIESPDQGESFSVIDSVSKDTWGHITSVDTKRVQMPLLNYPNSASHNSLFRGKYLGSSVTEAQEETIEDGLFDDLFIGDYWTIDSDSTIRGVTSTVNYRIGCFDYLYNCAELTTHHAVIIPDEILYYEDMNDSYSTDGGYPNSGFFNGVGVYASTGGITAAISLVETIFSSCLLKHTEYFTGYQTEAFQWSIYKDREVDLMTQYMVFGSAIALAFQSGENFVDQRSLEKTQLPLFIYAPTYVNTNESYWLRDVVSSTDYLTVDNLGLAYPANAKGGLKGVRPYFLIK